MVDFPVGTDEFPTLTEKRPGQFEATYHPSVDWVKGHLIAQTANSSEKRPYLFQVSWYEGKPDIFVTTGDPSNMNIFDRDGVGKPIRELKGMSRKHRPDIHAKALKIAEHVRNRVFTEQDWLRD